MAIFLLCIVLAFFALLLIIPIHLRISSGDVIPGHARQGLLAIEIVLDGENIVVINMAAFFFQTRIYPSKKRKGKAVRQTSDKSKRKFHLPSRRQLKFIVSVLWQTIKKSRVSKVYLNLDTSNVVVNSMLFPVFSLISERPRIDLNINYSGDFSLLLDVRNNLLNIIISMIRNFLKRT